jgi:hypothetical protein
MLTLSLSLLAPFRPESGKRASSLAGQTLNPGLSRGAKTYG